MNSKENEMKNAIEIGFLAAAIFVLSGCSALEKATGWAYEAEVSTQVLPDGTEQSVTNWVTKPNVKTGITIGGQLTPQPVGGIASQAILALLGIGAAIRGRQWKKAAVSGVEAAQELKQALNKSNAKGKLESILGNLKTQQKAAGTWALIRSILAKL